MSKEINVVTCLLKIMLRKKMVDNGKLIELKKY